MREEILANIEDAKQLEKLYQDNSTTFKKEFSLLYPEIKEKPIANFWNERLNYTNQEISWGSKNELTFVIIASLIAGIIAKFPLLFNIPEESFYQRNVSFIVFPLLTIYFSWKTKLLPKKLLIISIVTLLALIFINFLPNNNSDTEILACIHLPLFLWTILGFAFVGGKLSNDQRRIDFLKFNGEFLILTGLLLIAGGLLTGLSIGLFELLGFKIEKFYTEYVIVFGLAAAPLISTFITQSNPQLINRVSPVIAKLFCPLVLITLVAYLVAVIFSGKDLYNDRDFLMLFNAMLIGVMAIIFFSIAETSKTKSSQTEFIFLFLLSFVTIIVNGIALSAIVFRIFELGGITPNRLAVLGGNLLIFTNLLLVTHNLFKVIKKKCEIDEVEKTISKYLTVYSIWTMIVIFVFPFIFGFK